MHILMKHFSDLHLYDSIDLNKMEKLKEMLLLSNPTYSFYTGDLLNSNDVSKLIIADYLLRWVEEIAQYTRLFIIKGNHDLMSRNQNNTLWQYDFDSSFWDELSSIDNVCYLPKEPSYEDNHIYVSSIDLPFEYYENPTGKEDFNLLFRNVEMNKQFLSDLPNDKLKVLLCHSAKFLTNPEILSYLKEFDVFLSGHFHNGLVPNFLDRMLPGNRGIINPDMDIFPNISRGVKTINYCDKKIDLIINGGITKIPLELRLNILNFLYSMEITEISYDTDTKNVRSRKKY